jgi:protein-S-isoprenylcysteine O-methyltransferase Ste14
VTLRDDALYVVLGCAYLRVIAVLFGAVRSLRARRQVRAAKFGIVESAAAFEVVVLAGVAYPVYRAAADMASSRVGTVAACTGALLALIYAALLVGSVASWRRVHSGHLVLEDQELVMTGLYGIIRHPLYAGAFLLWAAVAVGNLSIVAAAVMLLFVVPTYWLYIRREEETLEEVFGDAYRNYCRRVPRFIPSPRRGTR